MADRYWVGGSGTWNGTNTANWSASSGGSSGASVPTAADNVFFDAGSDSGGIFTVTMATSPRVCADFTASSLDFTMTLAGTGISINISGNLSLPATNFTRTYTGTTTFNATTTGKTISTNGVTLGATAFNGVGGAWTLQNAFSSGGNSLTVLSGSFDTGSYNLTCATLSSTTATARTISLGSSTVTLSSDIDFTTSTNLTFNAGTSSITSTGSAVTIDGGGVTFNNYTRSNTTQTSPLTINGNNTFNNLTIAALAAAGIGEILLGGNQTINGTLTFSASANATSRRFLRSSTTGTARTVTCAAFSGADIDFRDIAGAGAAAPLSGTRLGDCKGNSGITFGAGVPKYWNLAAGGNWSATGWATGSGGTPAVNNFPLAQDTCIFEATGLNSGAAITINASYNIGTINMSARTGNTMTLTNSNSPDIHGDFISGTGVTYTGTGTFTITGRTTQTITSAGRTFTQAININSPSGTVLLADAFTTSRSLASAISLTRGTFDAAGYSVTLTGASSGVSTNNSNVRTLAFGSGTWTIAGTGGFNATDATNLTVTGTGVISLTNAGAKSFIGGGIQTYPTLNQGGTGALTVTGSNKFADITNSAIGSVLFTAGTTTTFDNFNLNGTSGNLLTLGSVTAASHTLSKVSGTVSSDYLSISRSTATGGATWYAGANSSNGGNNSGWIFSAPPVAASGNMFLLF
jgi:hypothetical protein